MRCSYVYDAETGLYYLQSRYYNPTIGRFLNADAFASTGQGLLGNNMFAYCLNNPVNRNDTTGCISYSQAEDPNDNNNPLDDVARIGSQRPVSPAKVSKGALKGVDVHAFKKMFVGNSVSQWDIFKDTANNSVLWLGNKSQTIWQFTGYFISELFEYFTK